MVFFTYAEWKMKDDRPRKPFRRVSVVSRRRTVEKQHRSIKLMEVDRNAFPSDKKRKSTDVHLTVGSEVYKICILGAKDALRILYKYGANQMHADKESLTGRDELHRRVMRAFSFLAFT